MKKYSKIIGITLILFTLMTVVFPFSKVYGAASASIKASKTTIYVGETTKITVSVNSTETWSLGITSNGGSLSGTPKDADAAGSEVSKQVISCDFTANTAGTYKINLSGDVAGSDLKKKSVDNFVTITVKNKEQTPVTPPSNNDDIPQETNPGTTTTKSSNNYLSSLKVSEGKLSPEFSFRTYNYTVDVGKEISSIKVTATTEHNKAKVSGTGTKTLKPGENKINITVKAEDGKERTYTIIVNKPEEKILLKSLKLQGVNVEEEKIELSYTPEFSSEVYEYSVTIPNDITKIDVEAIANNEDYIVEVTGNEELQEGENIITILVKAKDSDKVSTYKIKVVREAAVEAVATLDETPNTGEEQKWFNNNTIKIVIVTFTALVAIAGIVFAVIEYNYSRKHPKEEMGEIPYSEVGFRDEETDREDILEEPDYYIDEDEEIKQKKTRKKGKHF